MPLADPAMNTSVLRNANMVVHEVLPLEQAVLAHQKMAVGEVFGRIVLVPSG